MHPAIHVDPNNTEYGDGTNRSYIGIRSKARPDKSIFRSDVEPRLNIWGKGGAYIWGGIGEDITGLAITNYNYRTGSSGLANLALQAHNYPYLGAICIK